MMATPGGFSTAELRAHVDQLLRDGAIDRARNTVATRSLSVAPFHEYRWLALQLAELSHHKEPCRIAVLSTFTLEPIRDVLCAVALAQGMDPLLYFGGFQQMEQEVLTPASGLRKHDAEIIIFAWRLEDLTPALASAVLELGDDDRGLEIDRVLARIRALIQACRASLPRGRILMHTMVTPSWPALGVIDIEHPLGQTGVVARLNAGLLEIATSDPGVHLVDCDSVARRSGPAWFDSRHWYSASAPLGPEALVALAFEYVKYFRALAGRSKKVLVTDLDNTLWGGILGEEGVHAIELGPSYPGNAFTAFQREIKQLSRRGIVLAINSKNNESDVREVFEKHPHMPLRWEDFAGVRVNWTDKVTNMRQLAEELSLGLDSFVFIDDSPAEIEIVQRELPEVTTIQVPREPAQLPGLLARLGYFDSVLYTEEDRRRGELYRSQVKRLELERSSTNLEAFYRSLNMRLIIQTVDDADVPRVAQLTQRTNQFNLTTRRYSEADVRRVRDSETHVLRAYRLEDRFGDNGIIAVTIVATDGTAARLDTFLMSCRVIGRTLETAILAELVRELQGRGLKTLIGEFLPTKKNAPAKDVLEKHGFARSEAELDGTLWELSLHDPSLRVPEWITVISAPARG